jgi:hypothetical protein
MTRLLAPLIVLTAVAAAGCLPSGTRGEGTGPFGSGESGPPAPSTSPASAPRPTLGRPTPTPEPTFLAYVVKKGDSLNSIAHKFKTTARSVAFWNRATYPSLDPESAKYRPDLLKLGWTLLVRPNDVVDEQELPEPSSSADESGDLGDSGDAGDPAATDPIESAIAE